MKFANNTILFTRDGRKIGNALIYGSSPSVKGMMYYIVEDNGTVSLKHESHLAQLFYLQSCTIATNEHIHFNYTGA